MTCFERMEKLFIEHVEEVKKNELSNDIIEDDFINDWYDNNGIHNYLIRRLKTRFYFKYHLENPVYKEYMDLLENILFIMKNDKKLKSLNHSVWKKVIKYAMNSKRPSSIKEKIYGKEDVVLDSVNFLVKDGYRFEIIKSYPQLIEEDYKNLGLRISQEIDKIGGHDFLTRLLDNLETSYNREEKRYSIERQVSIANPFEVKKPHIPYGYLINVAISRMKKMNVSKIIFDEKYKEIITLAKHYVSSLNIEYYSIYETILLPKYEISNFIMNSILFDNVIKFRQYNYKYLIKITDNLIKPFWRDELPYEAVLNVVNVVFSHHKNMTYFSLNEIVESSKVEKKLVIQIMDMLSEDRKKLNKNFFLPNSISDMSIIPLIKCKKKYLMVNREATIFSIFNCLADRIRKMETDFDSKLGLEIESFIRKSLEDKGIKVKYGFHGDLECDLIIETEQKIVFIEIKKKAFTRSALAGNEDAYLNDISKSFLKSQVQLSKHELALLEDGNLILTSIKGRKANKLFEINHNQRDIEKISLSFQEHDFMNSHEVVELILNSLYNTTIEFPDEELSISKKELIKIQKNINDLTELTSKKKNITNDRRPYFNSHFLSVQQLLRVLNESNGTEEFVSNLLSTKHISTGSYDYYVDRKVVKQYAQE